MVRDTLRATLIKNQEDAETFDRLFDLYFSLRPHTEKPAARLKLPEHDHDHGPPPDRLELGEAMRLQHGSSETHFEAMLPDAVVFPLTTEEVVALVKLCVAAEVPLVPFGAGTSVEGNVTPVRGGVSVDLGDPPGLAARPP